MKRAGILLLFAVACGSDTAPDAALQVRVPLDRHLFQSITSYALRAERDGRVLAQDTTPANGSTLTLDNVPFGQRTVFTLDGITSAGDLVARGSSCPMDFEPHGDPVVIYFSPVNFFAPTPMPPNDTRMYPVAFALPTGEIVIAGGEDTSAMPVPTDSAETFSAPTGTFAVLGSPLSTKRSHAEIVDVPGVGALVVGGHAANQAPADLYDVSSQAFKPLTSQYLTAHDGHRLITLANGHILIIGGRTVSGTPTDQTVDIGFTAGVAQIMPGPALPTLRADHAAVVVVGTPLVFGGNNVANDLDEILLLKNGAFQHFPSPDVTMPPKLRNPRAGLTATALQDGTVLLVGGFADANCGAEVFNPVTQESDCVPTANARVEHTTTLLPDGRVLVCGGKDLVTGEILTSVELFVPGVGFVAERPLGTPRHGHVAVPLCDGTVLVTGGGPNAEIYNPPASN